MGKTGNRYTPLFQFQVVLEILKGDKEAVEIARVYGIHPTTVSTWKHQFLNKRPELFAKDTTLAQYEKRIRELERFLGRKEVQDRSTQGFCGGQLVTGDKVKLVNEHARKYGLNGCLATIGLPKSTWYCQKKEKVSYREEPKGTDNASCQDASTVWISTYIA